MIAEGTPIAFVPCRDPARSRPFYEEMLGLELMAEDEFALTFDAGGTPVRLTRVPAHQPAPYTIFGWEVDDLGEAVAELGKRGIPLDRFGRERTLDHGGPRMTRAEEIRQLYRYNRWANRRILEAASGLTEAALGRDLGSSFPSVLATLAHTIAGDWIWLRRWAGESPPGTPADWDLSSLGAVGSKWEEIETERSALLDSLDDEGLVREVAYRSTEGRPYTSRMDQMLRHVVNHSTYHRGQVVTMLRQLGATPPVTDLIAYYREMGPSGGRRDAAPGVAAREPQATG
ncbi:MAG TPA: DinB family protein [Longimicrobiales bacterium]|nr:DinB family protein [Longimicrobiales bacterium]